MQVENPRRPPLLCLPDELILEISELAVKVSSGYRFWITLTAICFPIREILISSPSPWRIINTDSIPLAKLFLKRCNFNPLALFVADGLNASCPTDKTQIWEVLEGRTFNNLHFLMFRGLKSEFEYRVVDLLRRAPNLSALEIDTCKSWDLEWTLCDKLPHLTMLRLGLVWIDWNVPILRNLTKLILNFAFARFPKKLTSVKTFLSVLKNCPDLEILHLSSAGPLPESDAEVCGEIVRLQKLKELVLFFYQQQTVACILSRIWFPGSTKVQVETAYYRGPYAALSRLLPHSDATIFQYLRQAAVIAIDFGSVSYNVVIDNFRLVLRVENDEDDPDPSNLETVPQFVSKLVEIIGSETPVALHVRSDLSYAIPRDVWNGLLHGLPHLKFISYDDSFEWSADYVDPLCSAVSHDVSLKQTGSFVDPFCSVLSEPFEGGLVCPHLRDLRIPWLLGRSAMTLKRTLLERGASGRRLKRISTSRKVEGEMVLLSHFKDVVDVISPFYTPTMRPSSPVSSCLEQK